MPTADFVRHRDANLRRDDRVDAIADAVGPLSTMDANRLSEQLLGKTIYANVMMLGGAWQLGLVPVTLTALLRAIELNGVDIEQNKQAFTWGRVAVHDMSAIHELLTERPAAADTLDQAIARRREFLVDYQDEKLAQRYEALVNRVRESEQAVGDDESLSFAVARSYFKLLSCKDEYEVARLHTQTGFVEQVKRDFGDNAKLRYHLAPPVLNGETDARGRPRKKEFGAWILPAFRLLASMKGLRGTALDLFGKTAERRMERALITEFEQQVDATILARLDAANHRQMTTLIESWMDIRGYGPVKEKAVHDVRERMAEILRELDKPATEKAA